MSDIKRLNHLLTSTLEQLIDQDFENGIQLAIYFHGELIADLSLGNVVGNHESTVVNDTLFPVCSTSKGVTSCMVHMLIEHGKLDVTMPVAHYHPAFAAHGKESTTVAQALSHQAGIPVRPKFDSYDEICNWDTACKRIANLPLEWEPGSRAQYHSTNWGWIIGPVIESAGGDSFDNLFKKMIAKPLGIDQQMYFGMDEDAFGRATLFEAQPAQRQQVTTAPSTDSSMHTNHIPGPLMEFVNRSDTRKACMPSVNGMMSAHAIAKLYAALIGPVDGIQLINDKTLEHATKLLTPPNMLPECFGHGFGLGYVLKGPKDSPGDLFGHGGAGGSEGMCNRKLDLAIGFTKNRMDTHSDAPGHTFDLIMKHIYQTFGREGDGGFYERVL